MPTNNRSLRAVKLPLIPDIPTYIALHRPVQTKIINYLEMAKSNYQTLDRDTSKQLDRSQAKFFHANNIDARIRFVTMVHERIAAYVDGADSTIDLHFVTLMPDDFAMPEAEAGDFDPAALQDWAAQALDGFDYVGMVEAALFPSWPKKGQPTISWHVHSIVFGAKRHQLDRQLQPLRTAHRTLVDGVDPVNVAAMSRSQLEEKVCYITKSPLKSYRPNPETKTEVDPTTGETTSLKTGGWCISKPELRTGEHVRLCHVMRNQQLDKLLFGGGAGSVLVRAIRRQIAPEEWS